MQRWLALSIIACAFFGAFAFWLVLCTVPLQRAISDANRYSADRSCSFPVRAGTGACFTKEFVVRYKANSTRRRQYQFTLADGSGRLYWFTPKDAVAGVDLYSSILVGGYIEGQFFDGYLVALVQGEHLIYGTTAPQARVAQLQQNFILPAIVGIAAIYCFLGLVRLTRVPKSNDASGPVRFSSSTDT